MIHIRIFAVKKMSQKFYFGLLIFTFFKNTSGFNLDCTNGVLRTDYITTETIYDTENKSTFQIYSSSCCNLQGQPRIEPENYKYFQFQLSSSPYYSNDVSFSITKLDEAIEWSQATVHYNFTLHLHCSNSPKPTAINIKIPIIDTNNHDPFFNKPIYIYDLFSTHQDDFKRLQSLHPIIATDYDVTNQEIVFSIEKNEYFDIHYHGVVPSSLKKSHSAVLVPKTSLTKVVNLTITATDKGYPPRTATSRLIINPPSPPKPVFEKNIYVGHYFKNYTFLCEENLRLIEGVNIYTTTTDPVCESKFDIYTDVDTNGDIKIINEELFDNFYKKNYIACVIEARYTDESTKLYSIGKTVLIVELHHDI